MPHSPESDPVFTPPAPIAKGAKRTPAPAPADATASPTDSPAAAPMKAASTLSRKPVARFITIRVPVVETGHYAQQRVDVRLTQHEAKIARMVMDGIESQQEPCAGPGGAVRHILQLLAAELARP